MKTLRCEPKPAPAPLRPGLLRRMYVLMQAYRAAQSGASPGRYREAVLAGAVVGLRAGDCVLCAWQDPRLANLMRSHNHPARLITPLAPAASCLLLAVGVALGQGERNGGVVLALADGAISGSGAWHEAALISASHKLPLIFVLDFSECPPAHAYGFPAIPVDASDAIAVHRVVHVASEHARKGNGPTLVECVRVRQTRDGRQAADPVLLMENCLRSYGLQLDEPPIDGAAEISYGDAVAPAGQRRRTSKS